MTTDAATRIELLSGMFDLPREAIVAIVTASDRLAARGATLDETLRIITASICGQAGLEVVFRTRAGDSDDPDPDDDPPPAEERRPPPPQHSTEAKGEQLVLPLDHLTKEAA
jgi:hypothetical protein